MEYFISNLEKSLTIDLPLLSLAGAFVLIDAISALDTEKGVATPLNFTNWITNYLPNYITIGISAEDYYKFRCALLHQLSGSREDSSVPTLLFFPKNSTFQGHMNRLNNALHFDIPTFVGDVVKATRACIAQSVNYKIHQHKIITFHKDGLEPYVKGMPVIGSRFPAKGKKLTF